MKKIEEKKEPRMDANKYGLKDEDMRFFVTTRITKSFRRGSALLLALVLTIALFIMGLVFVSTTQIEKETVSRVDELQTLDTAVDTVVGQINTVLVDDLIHDDKMLDGDGDSKGPNEKNENYDYPGQDDPWLASLEPYEYGAGTGDYRWRRISDIYNEGINNVLGSPLYDPVDRNNPDQWDSGQAAVSDYYILDIGTSGIRARIVADMEGTETIVDGGSWDDLDDVMLWGARADADGDGVADSRWVKVPNLTGPRGQNVYTAVRIIDNGGMININTAFRDPSNLTISGNWDGSRLSHINIEGVNKGSDNVWDFQWLRFGGAQTNTVSTITGSPPYLDENNYNSDKQYDNDVSQRILNPAVITIGPDVYHYTPLDIMDELELRNRGFVDSPTVCRLESLWTQTFLPGYSTSHLKTPYDDYTQLPAWFVKASDGISGYYTRRHICTTYSFDRIVRKHADRESVGIDTYGKRKTGIRLPNDGIGDYSGFTSNNKRETYLKQLVGAIYQGLPKDSVIKSRFGSEYTREILAYNYAVNMIDFQDVSVNADKPPVSFEVKLETGTEHEVQFFGVEDLTDLQRDVLCVSEIGYINVDSGTSVPPAPVPIDGDYYAIELFNPDKRSGAAGQKNLSKYEIRVVSDSGSEEKGTMRLTGTLEPSNPSTSGSGDTCVVVFAPSGVDASMAQTAFAMTAPPILVGALTGSSKLEADDRIIVIKGGDGNDGYPQEDYKMPVDCVKVTGPMVTGGANARISHERKYVLPGTHLLLPEATTTPLGFTIWATSSSLGNAIDPCQAGHLQKVTTTQMEGIDKVQLIPKVSGPLRGIGEIERVPAVGFYFDTVNKKCQTPLQGFVDSYKAIRTPDPTADQELGIEMGSFGKISLAEKNYWGLMDFLTYFDPSNDGVDNDGNNMTSDNPENDGVDQDGDGTDSPAYLIALDPAKYFLGPDSDEKQAQWYEQQVAGRININTAPWFVINQLPWVEYQNDATTTTVDLARAIVGYRDKIDLTTTGGPNYSGPLGRVIATFDPAAIIADPDIPEERGFVNIAQLMQVRIPVAGHPAMDDFDIRKYLFDGKNNNVLGSHDPEPGPFFSDDVADDDLLERDVLFQRISNLVTVRSDVFTAYIMVRVGELGPQKRVIAIFDRSNVYKSGDTPKLVALHPVPDPR